MTEQKYVSKNTDRPMTWHRNENCPRVGDVELVPVSEDRGLGRCAYCTNGISARELHEIGQQGDTA